MITDTDIRKLKAVFVTKDDLRRFSTKNNLADALRKYTTKDDFQELKIEVREIKEMVGKILTGMDGFTLRFDRLEMEYVGLRINDTRQDRQIQKIAKHTDISLRDVD